MGTWLHGTYENCSITVKEITNKTPVPEGRRAMSISAKKTTIDRSWRWSRAMLPRQL